MVTEPVGLLLLALGWMLLPGLLVGAAVGLRGWLLAGAAPALTMGFVAGAGVAFDALGIRWAPGAVVLALLLVLAGAVLPSVLRMRREGRLALPAYDPGVTVWGWWQHAGVGMALLVCAGLGVRTTFLATRGFDGINQTWDALFHFGAVRFIADSGDPSPASLAAIGAPASTAFYMPNAYHCLTALVRLVSEASVVPVVNAGVALLPLLLGLGTVALLRVVTGRPADAVCGGLFAAVVAAVPYHVVGYGTLLPYATALALLPGVLALLAALLRAPRWRVAVALGLAAAGLLHTHPQVAFLAAMIALVQVAWHLVTTRRLGLAQLRALGGAVAVAAVVGAPVLVALTWAVTRAEEIDWPAAATPGQALGNLMVFGAAGRQPQWWLLPLLLAGLAAAVAGGTAAGLRPFVGAGGLIAGLYVQAAAYDTDLSLRLTSLWWNDAPRLAAAFAVLAIAVLAVGAVWLRDRAVALLPAVGGPLGRVVPAALLVVLLVVFSIVTGGAYASPTRAALAMGYGSGPVLSATERAGLAQVDRIVRAGGGGMVMNDPHDGCGWGYALHGTPMVFPTPLTGPFDWDDFGHDRERLLFGFDRIDVNPQIREDATRLGIRWAVRCTGFIRSWQGRAPGLYNVGALPGTERVWANREVRLYRIGDPRTVPDRW